MKYMRRYSYAKFGTFFAPPARLLIFTDVLALKGFDEIGDTFVLRDASDAMCVERGPVEDVLVCSTK